LNVFHQQASDAAQQKQASIQSVRRGRKGAVLLSVFPDWEATCDGLCDGNWASKAPALEVEQKIEVARKEQSTEHVPMFADEGNAASKGCTLALVPARFAGLELLSRLPLEGLPVTFSAAELEAAGAGFLGHVLQTARQCLSRVFLQKIGEALSRQPSAKLGEFKVLEPGSLARVQWEGAELYIALETSGKLAIFAKGVSEQQAKADEGQADLVTRLNKVSAAVVASELTTLAQAIEAEGFWSVQRHAPTVLLVEARDIGKTVRVGIELRALAVNRISCKCLSRSRAARSSNKKGSKQGSKVLKVPNLATFIEALHGLPSSSSGPGTSRPTKPSVLQFLPGMLQARLAPLWEYLRAGCLLLILFGYPARSKRPLGWALSSEDGGSAEAVVKESTPWASLSWTQEGLNLVHTVQLATEWRQAEEARPAKRQRSETFDPTGKRLEACFSLMTRRTASAAAMEASIDPALLGPLHSYFDVHFAGMPLAGQTTLVHLPQRLFGFLGVLQVPCRWIVMDVVALLTPRCASVHVHGVSLLRAQKPSHDAEPQANAVADGSVGWRSKPSPSAVGIARAAELDAGPILRTEATLGGGGKFLKRRPRSQSGAAVEEEQGQPTAAHLSGAGQTAKSLTERWDLSCWISPAGKQALHLRCSATIQPRDAEAGSWDAIHIDDVDLFCWLDIQAPSKQVPASSKKLSDLWPAIVAGCERLCA